VARFKIVLEYAGTRYSGWQKQKNARTVQGEFERAVATVTGQRQFECQGSGRTDAGVHALMQVAHLDVQTNLPPETLRHRLNDELPPDVNILALAKAHHRFHARHSAVARSYLYQIARRRTAFAKPFVWWVKEPLNVDAMRDAASRFSGMHDFRSFSDDDPEEKSTDVLIEAVEIAEEGDLLLIRVAGSHFLWKMVRRMVGVLVEIGKGDLKVLDLDAFLSSPSGTPARVTAPASGLFLEHVAYSDDERRRPLTAAVAVRSSSTPTPGKLLLGHGRMQSMQRIHLKEDP
jgi:tRNA pseudouridine38-40 synthase